MATVPRQTPQAQDQQPAADQTLPPGQVADKLAAAGVVAAGAPAAAAAVAPAALAVATKQILGGFDIFLRGRRKDQLLFLTSALGREFPHRTRAELRGIATQEQRYELEFQRKQRARLERDLPKALAIPDREQRLLAVNKILERERRFTTMREEAMAARAADTAERADLKAASPEGAYWLLDPSKKNHTMGCVLMAHRGWWPWAVLDHVHPHRERGCGCVLLAKDEANVRELIPPNFPTADVADAVKSAHAILARERDVHLVASADEIAAVIDERIEEARYAERFPKGDPHGGEFKPKGAAAHIRAEVRKLLRRHIPELPKLQEKGTRQGRYVWLRGRYVFVPRHRAFNRKLDHVQFSSPAGSTNIYRNGRLVQIEGHEPPPHHHDLNPPAEPDVRNLPGTPIYNPAEKADPGGSRIVGVRPVAGRKPFPAEGPLPMENGLYYRFHVAKAPFGAEHATSRNLVTDEELAQMSPEIAAIIGRAKEGYSAFWNPHHLDQYLTEMHWDEAADAKARRVIAFYGRPVGGGGDGEPLVIPDGTKPVKTMSLTKFRDRLDVTGNGYGRWYEHTWGDGPDGQIADDGYRALGEKQDPGDRPAALRMWDELTPDQADVALKVYAEQERNRQAIDDRIRDAMSRMEQGHPPVAPGDYTVAASDLLENHGFVLPAGQWSLTVGSDLKTGTATFVHQASRAEVSYDFNRDTGLVTHVVWQPGWAGWDAPHDPLDHPPRNWEEWADEVRGVAYRLGHEYGQDVSVGEVHHIQKEELETPDELGWDHSGSHLSATGLIRLGVDTDDILAVAEQETYGRPLLPHEVQGAYASYKVGVHEALHAVNPIDPTEYNGMGRAIEEALVEELAHVETAKLIRAHNAPELLDWARKNPNDIKARGTYGAYRAQLDRVLNTARIAPEEREDFMRDLKFRRYTTERISDLTDAVWQSGDPRFHDREVAKQYVRDVLGRGERGRSGIIDYHRFVPVLRPDLRDFAPAEGAVWNGMRVTPGSWVRLHDGSEYEVTDVRQTRGQFAKFKLTLAPIDGVGKVKHDVLDGQLAAVWGHRDGEEPLLARGDEEFRRGVDLYGPDVKVDGKRATIGAIIQTKRKLLATGAKPENRNRYQIIGWEHDESGKPVGAVARLFGGEPTIIGGREMTWDFPPDEFEVVEEGPEPQRVTVGDTIRYDGRRDGGTSEAKVTQVIPLSPNWNVSTDAPRYVIEAVTTENSLRPDTLVWLTEERMNGVSVQAESVARLPINAVAAEPLAVAADPGVPDLAYHSLAANTGQLGEKADPGSTLDSLNPTGGLFVAYDPSARATATLGGGLTTLDKTMGVSPDEPVRIYRGAPTSQTEIQPGDYVTTNRQLAANYAGVPIGHVIETTVPASHVLDDASEPLGEEYIYRSPQHVRRLREDTDGPSVATLLEALGVPEAESVRVIGELLVLDRDERLAFVDAWLLDMGSSLDLLEAFREFDPLEHPRGRGGRWRDVLHLRARGYTFHGSHADPTHGRASPGDEAGFFTAAEPEHAAWYAMSDVRNEIGGAGRVYAVPPPKRPLDLRTKAGMEELATAMESDAKRLEDDFYAGTTDLYPFPFAKEVARARAAISGPEMASHSDVRAFIAPLYSAAMEWGKLHGLAGFDVSYVNEKVRQLGYDSFVSTEANKATGEPAEVVVHLDRPEGLVDVTDALEPSGGLAEAFREWQHPRTRAGQWARKLWHVAPHSQRENIAREGLMDKLTGKNRVFLWATPEDTLAYHKIVGGDVYEVDPHGVDLAHDPWWDEPGRRERWGAPGESRMAHGVIPPENVRRIEPHELTGEKADPGTGVSYEIKRNAADVLQLPKSGKGRTLMQPTLDALDKVMRLPDLPAIPVKTTSGKNLRGGYQREQIGDLEVEKWEGPTVRMVGYGTGRSDRPAKPVEELQPGDEIVLSAGYNSKVLAVEERETQAAFGRPPGRKIVVTLQRDSEGSSAHEAEYKPGELVAINWTPTVTGTAKWKPANIKVSATDSNTTGESGALTLAHEFGHFFDNAGFTPADESEGGHFESTNAMLQALGRDGYTEAAMKVPKLAETYPYTGESPLSEWLDAVRATDAWDKLGSASMVDYATHKYLLSVKELWARSFAQWLATRSQEPKLLAQLQAFQQLPPKRTIEVENYRGEKLSREVDTPNHLLYRQWQSDDFKPVGAAIDRVMEGMGWRR